MGLETIDLVGNVIFPAVLGFMWVMYMWETYLTIRQVRFFECVGNFIFENDSTAGT